MVRKPHTRNVRRFASAAHRCTVEDRSICLPVEIFTSSRHSARRFLYSPSSSSTSTARRKKSSPFYSLARTLYVGLESHFSSQAPPPSSDDSAGQIFAQIVSWTVGTDSTSWGDLRRDPPTPPPLRSSSAPRILSRIHVWVRAPPVAM